MGGEKMEYGFALYYPYIHFHDVNWIKTAVLYYDGLKRIVPENFAKHDNKIVKALYEANFIEHLDPR
jgi:hypothetical protein